MRQNVSRTKRAAVPTRYTPKTQKHFCNACAMINGASRRSRSPQLINKKRLGSVQKSGETLETRVARPASDWRFWASDNCSEHDANFLINNFILVSEWMQGGRVVKMQVQHFWNETRRDEELK